MEQVYTPKQNYKVLVHTITYNQSKYITDTLDGVAMQQTNFPFVHYIIDDCSTDCEQDVIKSWINDNCDMDKAEFIDLELANVILVPHKSNANLFLAIYFLKRNLFKDHILKETFVTPWREHCNYEAYCEGDDYWTNPLKLHIQVEYLDSHPGCGLVYTKVNKYVQSKNAIDGIYGKKCNHLDLLLGASPVPTLSVCYRIELQSNYIDSITTEPEWQLSDVPLWLYFIKYSSIHFIDEITGVYRELNESASHSMDFNKRSSFINSAFDCRAFYAERYWGKTLANRVAEAKLFNLINISFEFDKKLELNIFSDIRKYKIFNIKLYILYLFSCSKGMRHYYHNRIFKNKQ